MGAVNIAMRVKGNTLRDAYKSAVDDAIDEYGKDAYNGTISTTDGVKDMTSYLTQLMNEKPDKESALRKWKIDAWDSTSKWEQVWGAKIADNTYILAGWAAE